MAITGTQSLIQAGIDAVAKMPRLTPEERELRKIEREVEEAKRLQEEIANNPLRPYLKDGWEIDGGCSIRCGYSEIFTEVSNRYDSEYNLIGKKWKLYVSHGSLDGFDSEYGYGSHARIAVASVEDAFELVETLDRLSGKDWMRIETPDGDTERVWRVE